MSTFDKDVLISYAHIDDESLMEGQKGWIAEFHRALEIRLSQLMGAKPKIWRDPKLQGNDFFGEEIVDQLPEVKVLISILSPRYVRSEWCTKEVREFSKASLGNVGLRVRNKSRIFKVIKTPVPLDDHPEEIRDTLGYEFYIVDPETGRHKEFSRMYGKDMELAYWKKLDDVAHDLVDLIDQINDLKESAPGAASDPTATADAPAPSTSSGAPAASDEAKPCVYIAETSYDMREFRQNLTRELQEHGYDVLPDRQLPLMASDLEEDVREMLSRSLLSIHPVGDSYGIVPEGSEKSVIMLQNSAAANFSKEEKLPRLIWLHGGEEIEDQRQVMFVRELQNNDDLLTGADVFESSLEEFKFAIHDKLHEIKKAAEAQKEEPKAMTVDGPPLVYVICTDEDFDELAELEEHLFNEGFDVMLPSFDGEDSTVREEHVEALKECDAALIYYGAGRELWVRAKMRDFLKIAGYGRTKAPLVAGVYVGGPPSPQKDRFRAHNMTVINGQQGFDPAALESFTNQLK